MMVASKTEDYQLLGDILDQRLKELGYSREDLNVELFASDKQHVLDLYCTKEQNCCYELYWPSFGMAYRNPRFSELGKVLTKLALEWSCMVLCSPDWGAHGGNEYWRTALEKLTLTSIQLPLRASGSQDAYWETRMGEHATRGGLGPSPNTLGRFGTVDGPGNST